MLDLLSQFDMDLAGNETDETRSLRARLRLLQGDLEGALRWADAFVAPVTDRPLIWLQQPHISRARILLARGAPADAREALDLASSIGEIAERTHSTRFQITSLLVRGLALDAQGQVHGAEAAVQQAIALAQPGGFLRVFVDLGARMQAQLNRLAGQRVAAAPTQRFLAAFPESEADAKPQPEPEILMHGPLLKVPGLTESLTTREREILALLREPLPGKEIAHQLYISSATLKRHTSNIYGKLGVHTRWEAIRTAEALGILPPR